MIDKEKKSVFGDLRLDKRFNIIIKTMTANPGKSIYHTFLNTASKKAAYNFFSNNKVTHDKIIDIQKESLIEKLKKIPKGSDVLIIQDTTQVNYSNHHTKTELNPTNSSVSKGLKVHTAMVTTSNKVPLGILSTYMYTGKSEADNSPCSKPESYRWIEVIIKATELAENFPHLNFIILGDRESDFYEFLASIFALNLYYISRVARNRETNQKGKRIEDIMREAPVRYCIVFLALTQRLTEKMIARLAITKKGSSKRKLEEKKIERQIKQEVKFESLTIKCPKHRIEIEQFSEINPWIIDSQEINTPKDFLPVNRRLLTNYPVKSIKDSKKNT